MSDPALTPEVLEELRWLAKEWGILSDARGKVASHLPALLATAQRVQELQADRKRLDILESWVTTGKFRELVETVRVPWSGTFREWLDAADAEVSNDR